MSALWLWLACTEPAPLETPTEVVPQEVPLVLPQVEAAPAELPPTELPADTPAPELPPAEVVEAPAEVAEAPPVPTTPAPAPKAPAPTPAPVAAEPVAPEPVVPEPDVPRATPVTYTLDPKQGWLYVVVRIDPGGVGAKLGHDHAIVSRDFTGTVTWDPSDLSACAVDLSLPVASLQVDPKGARERAKLDPGGAVSDKDKVTIRENLSKASQLDAAKHPTIRYTATRCTAKADAVEVTGQLTIRGVSQEVRSTLSIQADAGSFRATGGFRTTHTAFGFEPYSTLLGQLRNQDRLDFVLDLRGRP